VDDGSTIYLPFFISFYYCMYYRMLVLSCSCMPVLLLLIVGLHVSRASCLLLTLYVRVLLLLHC
jgi:hypothetical protein